MFSPQSGPDGDVAALRAAIEHEIRVLYRILHQQDDERRGQITRLAAVLEELAASIPSGGPDGRPRWMASAFARNAVAAASRPGFLPGTGSLRLRDLFREIGVDPERVTYAELIDALTALAAALGRDQHPQDVVTRIRAELPLARGSVDELLAEL